MCRCCDQSGKREIVWIVDFAWFRFYFGFFVDFKLGRLERLEKRVYLKIKASQTVLLHSLSKMGFTDFAPDSGLTPVRPHSHSQ